MKKIFLLVFCISLLTVGIINVSCKAMIGCICTFTITEDGKTKSYETIYSGDDVKASGSKNCEEYTSWAQEQLSIVKNGEVSCTSNEDL